MDINCLELLNFQETQALVLRLSRDEFALAIKSADVRLSRKWYRCITARAKAMIQEDHRRLCEVSPLDIEDAVAAVFSRLREGVAEGHIRLRPAVIRALERYLSDL